MVKKSSNTTSTNQKKVKSREGKQAAVEQSGIEWPQPKPDTLSGLKFLCTGVFSSISKDTLSQLIKACGGHVYAAMSANINYLVVGNQPGKAKLKAAEDARISILTEQQFQGFLRAKMDMPPVLPVPEKVSNGHETPKVQNEDVEKQFKKVIPIFNAVQQQTDYALIKTTDGRIMRVPTGNLLGKQLGESIVIRQNKDMVLATIIALPNPVRHNPVMSSPPKGLSLVTDSSTIPQSTQEIVSQAISTVSAASDPSQNTSLWLVQQVLGSTTPVIVKKSDSKSPSKQTEKATPKGRNKKPATEISKPASEPERPTPKKSRNAPKKLIQSPIKPKSKMTTTMKKKEVKAKVVKKPTKAATKKPAKAPAKKPTKAAAKKPTQLPPKKAPAKAKPTATKKPAAKAAAKVEPPMTRRSMRSRK